MEISFEPILYGIIFVAVLMLIEGIYLVVFGKSISLNSKVNRRLDMIQKGGSREKVLEQLRKEMNQHMNSGGIPLYSMLADKAVRANIAFTPMALIGMMFVLAIVIFAVLSQMTDAAAPVRGLIALAMGIGAVYVWVNNKCKKRLALMEEVKTFPIGAVWDEYCRRQDVPVGPAWLDVIRDYEATVLSKR